MSPVSFDSGVESPLSEESTATFFLFLPFSSFYFEFVWEVKISI
jgi:hypothetical protein